MNFTQKVYYLDKPVILTNDILTCKTVSPETNAYLRLSGLSRKNFLQALDHLEAPENTGVIIEEHDAEALMAHMDDYFKVIQAGGGVVYNPSGEILFIFRRGKWDLPKGKLDKGETLEECALREVSEETGVQALASQGLIVTSWHIYKERGSNLVKQTEWYRMTTTDTRQLNPQTEEDIMEARWVAPADVAPLMANTYQAIKDVLHAAGVRW